MEQEILIPTSLNEVTLEQYQAFMRVVDQTDDELFIAQKMVSLFCKIQLSQVMRVRKTDITDIVRKFTELLSKDYPLTRQFELGGKKFGFITNIEEMSFGEYVDLEGNIGDWETMNKAMAVMYRPIVSESGEKYLIEPYESTINYSEVMRYAPLDVVFGAMVFFYRLSSELLTATLSYLEEALVEMSIHPKVSSMLSGDGIIQYMHSLREMSDALTLLHRYPSFSVLLGSHTKTKE